MEREIREYQSIIDELVICSSRGSYPVNKPGFVSVVARISYPSRRDRIRKVENALSRLEEIRLIEIEDNKIHVKKDLLKYSSKNL
jgi:hypothetical protein